MPINKHHVVVLPLIKHNDTISSLFQLAYPSLNSVADSYYWYTYLQRPTNHHVTDFILEQYTLLFSRYMADRDLVPVGRLHELSFDDLESDPIAALREIYSKFG